MKTTKSSKPTGYDVGFGKPPEQTKFKKGKSGNPRGRPRGSKGLAQQLDDLLKEKVPFGTTGKKISMREYILRRQVLQAMKGDAKSFKAIWDSLKQSDGGENFRPIELVVLPEDLKV